MEIPKRVKILLRTLDQSIKCKRICLPHSGRFFFGSFLKQNFHRRKILLRVLKCKLSVYSSKAKNLQDFRTNSAHTYQIIDWKLSDVQLQTLHRSLQVWMPQTEMWGCEHCRMFGLFSIHIWQTEHMETCTWKRTAAR